MSPDNPTDRRGLYIHVPFCASRCGYCDFNTYTAQELDAHPGSTTEGYLDALERELARAAELWPGPVDTVFFGGGTPSILGSAGLSRALRAAQTTLGLTPGAEVTTEANPESTSPQFFADLRDAGFTRISLGMQSAASHVLRILDRRHTPGRALAAAREARSVFDHVNLDLIYGTPGETDDDLRRSLDMVLAADVDHVSAYSLIVEDGTALGRRVRRGELPAPDDNVLADRYTIVDTTLRDAGMAWYEVSNWARPGGECRHNLLYWRGGQWWGAGPGAHGCVASPDLADSGALLTRTVNAKRPATYYDRLTGGEAWYELEQLGVTDIATERLMVGLRLAEGMAIPLGPAVRGVLHRWSGRITTTALTTTPTSAAPTTSTPTPWAHVAVGDAARYLVDGFITDIALAVDEDGTAPLLGTREPHRTPAIPEPPAQPHVE